MSLLRGIGWVLSKMTAGAKYKRVQEVQGAKNAMHHCPILAIAHNFC